MKRRILKSALIVTSAFLALIAVACVSLYAVHWHRLERMDCRVAVLMYHELVTNTEQVSRYAIHEHEFSRQMDALRQAGAVTRPIDDVLHALRFAEAGECPFLPNEVVITFDVHGGGRHGELAVPHLERNGLIAHFFLVTGTIQTAPIPDMVNSGMVFGSHTETHEDLPRIPSQTLIPSLEQSRSRLSALTGQSANTLAAPGGRYDERVIRDVAAAGFDAFFTSDPCYLGPNSSPLRLCRIEIRGDRGPTALDALQSPRRVAFQATSWRLKRVLEYLIGTDRFQGLSRAIHRLGGSPF